MIWYALLCLVFALFAGAQEVTPESAPGPPGEPREDTIQDAAAEGGAERVLGFLAAGVDVNQKGFESNTALHFAARRGRTNIVAILLENGADVRVRNFQGETPLHLAARIGRVKLVEMLLARSPDVDAPSRRGATPMDLAVDRGRIQAVNLLRENGATYTPHHAAYLGELITLDPLLEADPDLLEARNYIDFTLLHAASVAGQDRVVTRLLELGADVNVRGPDNVTPLILAARRGRLSTVMLLLSHGGDYRLWSRRGLNTVQSAISDGQVQVTSFLLEQGIPFPRRRGPWTPLVLAADQGNIPMMRVLLRAGADPDERGSRWDERRRPVHFAARRTNVRMMELLREAGADINRADTNGVTSLMEAVGGRPSPELVTYMIAHGADVAAYDDRGRLPITVAASVGSVESTKMLLDAGSPMVAPGGVSALYVAAQAGSVPVIRLLLDRGADATVRDEHGRTPLHMAVAADEPLPVVELLLAAGARLDLRDKYGHTPLHAAAKLGRTRVVALLLDEGADPSRQDKLSKTPLDLARERSHLPVVDLLGEALAAL